MNRYKQREHIFKIIFSNDFKTFESFTDLTDHYLEELADELAKVVEIEDTEEESNQGVVTLLSDENKEAIEAVRNKSLDLYNHLEEIDEKINAGSNNWNVQRIAKVELALIRLGIYEILFDESVPQKVAVNEAVELAKKFGGDKAPGFVNGVLSSVINK